MIVKNLPVDACTPRKSWRGRCVRLQFLLLPPHLRIAACIKLDRTNGALRSAWSGEYVAWCNCVERKAVLFLHGVQSWQKSVLVHVECSAKCTDWNDGSFHSRLVSGFSIVAGTRKWAQH